MLFKKLQHNFTFFAILIAVLIPLIAILAEISVNGPQYILQSILQIHLDHPLIWVIDFTGLVIITVCWFAGKNLDKMILRNKRKIELIDLLEAEKINHTLYKISNAVNTTFNLKELYALIHQSLNNVTDATNFQIALYDKQLDLLSFPYYVDEFGVLPTDLENVRQEDHSMMALVINQKTSVLLKDKEIPNTLLNRPLVWLGVPLKIKNEVMGVIAIQSYKDSDKFDNQDMDFLNAISAQIALAIERKQQETSLQESEKRYRNLIENIKEVIFSTDSRGSFSYISPSVELITGYSLDEISGKTPWCRYALSKSNQNTCFENIIVEEDRRIVSEKIQKAIDFSGHYEVEYRIVTKDQKTNWLYEKGQIISNKNGKIHLEGFIINIQERKHAELINIALYAISNAVNSTLNLNDLYVSIHRTLDAIINVKNFYIAIHDPKQDVITFPFNTDDEDELDSSDIIDAGKSTSFTAEVIRTGKRLLLTRDEQAQYAKQKGRKIIGKPSAIWMGVPLIVKKQVIGAMVAQSYDNEQLYSKKDMDLFLSISDQVANAIERKMNEDELRKSKEYAEAGTQSKSEFLANMSHEIRTPLNAIIGFLNLVIKTKLTNKQLGYIQNVKTASGTLFGIINDILDFSKIEAGKLIIEKISFHPKDILKSIKDMFSAEVKEKKLQFRFINDVDLTENIIGDPLRIKQILINLVSNAIKFTESGRITIKTKLIESTFDKSLVKFTVKDTGIGISKEFSQSLFESFTQMDGSTTRQFGGTGLGLAICKQLIEMMGGKITVDSAPEKGSEFSFAIWFKKTKSSKHKINYENVFGMSDNRFEIDPCILGKRILLAEDNIINQKVIKEILNFAKLDVTIVNNGQEAVNAAKSNDFDLVLMDIQMPVMDGYEATQIIKNDVKTKILPIIAMTAHAMMGDREKCIKKGMDDYLTKPVSPNKLFKLIAKHIPPLSGNPTSSSDKQGDDAKLNLAIPDQKIDGKFEGINSDFPGINIKAAIDRLGGNANLYWELIKKFNDDYGNFPELLQKMENKNQLEEALDLAHTVKGISSNLCFEKTYELINQAEKQLKSGVFVDVTLIIEIENSIATIRELLANNNLPFKTKPFGENLKIDKENLSDLFSQFLVLIDDADIQVDDCFNKIRILLNQNKFETDIIKMDNYLMDYNFNAMKDLALKICYKLELTPEQEVVN